MSRSSGMPVLPKITSGKRNRSMGTYDFLASIGPKREPLANFWDVMTHGGFWESMTCRPFGTDDRDMSVWADVLSIICGVFRNCRQMENENK